MMLMMMMTMKYNHPQSPVGHQLYRQPAEDSTCVCSCPVTVETALVSAAAHQLYSVHNNEDIIVSTAADQL